MDNARVVILGVVRFEGRRRDDSWRSPARDTLNAILSIVLVLNSRRKRSATLGDVSISRLRA